MELRVTQPLFVDPYLQNRLTGSFILVDEASNLAELGAARAAGCLPVTLGPLTLRAESMPVAALAALSAIWQK